MKFSGLGRGDSEPTPDDIEQEAADELRRAIGGAGQGRSDVPSYKEARNMAAEGTRADGDYDDYDDYDDYQPARRPTADDERRMATDLAMQQLAERPQGQGRNRAGATSRPMPVGDAEDLRNRALAAALDRQRRMQQKKAPDDPSAPRPKSLDVHGAQSRVQRVSGANITPSISAKPTLGGFHAPPPDAVPMLKPSAEAVHKGIAEARAAVAFGGVGGAAAGSRPAGNPRGGSPTPPPGRPAATTGGAAARRAAPPPTAPPPTTEMEELEEVIARADEGQALPAVAKWLSDEVDSSVALVMVVDEVLDDFVAWPTDSAIARELMEVVEQPLDHSSTIWTAMTEGRPLSNRNGSLVMPDGAEAEGCEWLVVPIVIDSEPLGAVFVTRGEGDTYSPAGVKFVENIADRLAQLLVDEAEEEAGDEAGDEAGEEAADHRADRDGAVAAGPAAPTETRAAEPPVTAEEPGQGLSLSNELSAAMKVRLAPRGEGVEHREVTGPAAEDGPDQPEAAVMAANGGGAPMGRANEAPTAPADGDKGVSGALPDSARDWLIALRVVLEGFGSAPSLPMPQYHDILGEARGLRDQIVELLTLTGPGGPGRGAES